MTLAQLTAYAESIKTRREVPIIVTPEWVKLNHEESVRLGIIDQDGNVINTPFIKD